MPFTVPNTAETVLANHLCGKVAAGVLKLHLFKNDAVIDEDAVIGDLTELTEAGYGAITLTAASWTVADGVASFAQQTFTMTEAVDVYGAYITDNAGTGLVAVVKFADAPHSLPAGGGSVLVTPSISVA